MRFPILSRIFLGLSALLFVAALFTRIIFSSWDVASLFFLSSSFVGIAISVVLNLQGFYEALRPRTIRRGMKASGYLGAIFAFLILANFAVSYFPRKIDLTTQSSHTLSDFSRNVAKSFDDTVEFLYLQIPGPDSKYADDAIRIAVKKYQDENPRILFKKYDLLAHPELAQKYQLTETEQGLFIAYKDRYERFYKTDENSITQSLLRLLKGRKNIYFSVGHDESKIDNENGSGLTSLKKEIQRLFFDVAEINLENEMLPKDVAGLVIIGPEKNLSPRVQEKILDFIKEGGRVFLAFDPIFNADKSGFLKHFGLKMVTGVVHQEENALATLGSHVVAAGPGESRHPIVADLGKESPVMFYVTGALQADGKSSFEITPLLVSDSKSVLRAGFTKQDKQIGKGPFQLLVSAKLPGDGHGEIIISADRDLFGNQFLYQYQNPALMFNLFSYLSKDADIIKAKPPIHSIQDFLVTDTRFKIYVGLFILPLPLLLFGGAGFLWFRRRWL